MKRFATLIAAAVDLVPAVECGHAQVRGAGRQQVVAHDAHGVEGVVDQQPLLETHGLDTVGLARVIDRVDVVSMDWKLVSDVRRAGDASRGPVKPFHEEHERFLEVACRAPEVVIKVVVTRATRDAELEAVAERVARVERRVTLVVQPVTPFGAVKEPPDAARLLAVVARLSHRLADVRLIPQTHKLLGAL